MIPWGGMLAYPLLHPEILAALGRAGHGAKVLIADGNYPSSTTLGPNARLVSLNLSPGVVSGPQVLAALASAIPIEAAGVMQYATSGPEGLTTDPPIWARYAQILHDAGVDVDLERIERFAFYEASRGRDVALTIATGELALYANLMLRIGVVG